MDYKEKCRIVKIYNSLEVFFGLFGELKIIGKSGNKKRQGRINLAFGLSQYLFIFLLLRWQEDENQSLHRACPQYVSIA